MRKVSGLEAVYRDYGPKRVKFFFVYKALAHPERSGILQPVTQDERLAPGPRGHQAAGQHDPVPGGRDRQPAQARAGRPEQLRVHHRPRGQDRPQADLERPRAVRKDLEELVGKVDKITKPEDVVLKIGKPPADAAAKGVVQKISRIGHVAARSPRRRSRRAARRSTPSCGPRPKPR